ncbi:hypothetical protein EUAN_08790 [Andreesenia angusta]|uniref:DUF6906 domain-containing protein n=1 Tax=Andreesenia angusta TaxID=39480 RepID=A0A1S1V9K7_9FIRM|nr:hypothetical protein [Andreesenia angusta]OHW63095.1 hypothetical protein EUAN_08790 [Andreesenia angusta]
MKHGKKPTARQKQLMTDEGLDCREWLVTKDTPDLMEIVNRESGRVKEIGK